jgi:glycosyltransferase involved in cell wall biosynthesis
MAGVMHQVLADEERQAEMRAHGLARAARFSWSRAAEETMAVYENVKRKR